MGVLSIASYRCYLFLTAFFREVRTVRTQYSGVACQNFSWFFFSKAESGKPLRPHPAHFLFYRCCFAVLKNRKINDSVLPALSWRLLASPFLVELKPDHILTEERSKHADQRYAPEL